MAFAAIIDDRHLGINEGEELLGFGADHPSVANGELKVGLGYHIERCSTRGHEPSKTVTIRLNGRRDLASNEVNWLDAPGKNVDVEAVFPFEFGAAYEVAHRVVAAVVVHDADERVAKLWATLFRIL